RERKISWGIFREFFGTLCSLSHTLWVFRSLWRSRASHQNGDLLVGAARFELATPSPPDWCANQAAPRSDLVGEAKGGIGGFPRRRTIVGHYPARNGGNPLEFKAFAENSGVRIPENSRPPHSRFGASVSVLLRRWPTTLPFIDTLCSWPAWSPLRTGW